MSATPGGPDPGHRIVPAESPADFAAFGALVRDYVAWCRVRYREHPGIVDAAFSHQALDRELEQLSGSYAPPHGRTLLAVGDGEIRGCVAYRRLSAEVCEMKRLFVPDRFQGRGLGGALCRALIASAVADGFNVMRLDTGILLHEAQALYRALGFAPCAPYNDYPADVAPFLAFMERPLA